jgi:predicted nucleotidyltransferase
MRGGEQHTGSNVDLIVGFKEGTPWDDVNQKVYHFKKTLPHILGRDVDTLYMRNMEIWGYVMLQALLSAKTIYEAGPWLYKNQILTRKFLADGHHKFKDGIAFRVENSEVVG